MAIVNTITSVYQFERQFAECGRGEQFSYEGLKVLYDYLDNLSDETGENIELDVIALCCEYAESTYQELIEQYNIDVSEAEGDENSIAEIVKEYISEHTAYCGETSDGLVYASF